MKRFMLIIPLLILLCSCKFSTESELMKDSQPSETSFISVPSSHPEKSSTLISSVDSSPNTEAKKEFDPWISTDEPELSPIYDLFWNEKGIQTSFLYVTDSDGNPIPNLMCYFLDADIGSITYSMPCGLIPQIWLREPFDNGQETLSTQILLINPNTDGTEQHQQYDIELDLTGRRAYHIIWDMETPNSYVQNSEKGITISLKYEDGTPAAGVFVYINPRYPLASNEDRNPAAGYTIMPGEIPNGMIGNTLASFEMGRYSDPQGNVHFQLDPSCNTNGIYYGLDIYEASFFIRREDFHPWRIEVSGMDENGSFQRKIETVLTSDS